MKCNSNIIDTLTHWNRLVLLVIKRRTILLAILISIASLGESQPLNRAKKKMYQYNYAQAIKILSKAVDKYKFHDEAITLLAECYWQQKDIENAQQCYSKAMEQPNITPEITLRYAEVLMITGDYSKAKEYFEKYMSHDSAKLDLTNRINQCNLLLNEWTFLEPNYEVKQIPSLNSPESDFGPAFYANGFTFSSDRGYVDPEEGIYGWTGRKYLNIYFAKPRKNGDFFGEYRKPFLMKDQFNQTFHDGPMAFAGDSVAVFTRSFRDRKALKTGKIKTNYLKVFSTRRIQGEWQKPMAFNYNSYEFSVGHPALSPNGKMIVFASDRPGGSGRMDLYYSTMSDTGWSTPVNLGSTINTQGNEVFPYLRNDGVLFFASDGHAGYGGLDLYCIPLKPENDTKPENLLAPVNSSYDDFACTWIPGTNFGLFSSDRPGGQGLDDIYIFKKLPEKIKKEEKKVTYRILGVVKDKDTAIPIPGAIVLLLDQRTDSIYVTDTDSNGIYRADFKHQTTLIVKAVKKMYIPDGLVWPGDQIRAGTVNDAPRELLLSKLESQKSYVLQNIYYDFDKYSIRTDAEPALDNLVRIMQENNVNIEVSSHTDCRGSQSYNEKLSQLRAESAVNYLIINGINKARISCKGYGERHLVNHCSDGVKCSPAEHQANRRTEFKITSLVQESEYVPDFDPDTLKIGSIMPRSDFPPDFFMNSN